MNPGLRTSASGMKAQQLMVDTIANNLANVNTTGFKRSRVLRGRALRDARGEVAAVFEALHQVGALVAQVTVQ